MDKQVNSEVGVACALCDKSSKGTKTLYAHFTCSVDGRFTKGKIYQLPCGCVELVRCIGGAPAAQGNIVPKYKNIEDLTQGNPGIKVTY